MLAEKLERNVVKVAPPFPIEVAEGSVVPTTVEDYAVSIFAETGRTVMVTRRGDCPIVPLREYDKLHDCDLIIKVAERDEIDKLLEIPEMRKRFQILESVPYTDIIIGHEVPTEAQIALKKKRQQNFNEGLHLAAITAEGVGRIAWVLVKFAAIAAFYTVVVVAGIALGALCGKDPIVWARLEDGSWLELARFYI